jgi:hypothetical protein
VKGRRRQPVPHLAAELMLGRLGWEDIPEERRTSVRYFIERRVKDLTKRTKPMERTHTALAGLEKAEERLKRHASADNLDAVADAEYRLVRAYCLDKGGDLAEACEQGLILPNRELIEHIRFVVKPAKEEAA